MARALVIAASSLAHAAFVIGLGRMEAPRVEAPPPIDFIEVQQAPPPEPPPEPPPVEAPPVEAPKLAPTPKAAPAPKAAAEQAPTPSDASPLDALPNLGLELGGVAAGGGGFAVRQGTGPRNADPNPVRKALVAPPARKAEPVDACNEPEGKPSVIELPRPSYTEAARSAGIEGKVRVRITVDVSGAVVQAEVLEGLGHGLDDAALQAARAARFAPALRCGKPSRSTFTLSIRFSAS